ncbi:MAG: glycoside hydrolase family 127 protein [Kiritimatiellae bacterium]|nr:glycoside hydrolase family 127 protein [Kiritimatiellia bacterium]
MKTTRILQCLLFAVVAAAADVSDAAEPAAFRQLAPGAVRPEGWLMEQLVRQADGLTGHAEQLYDDIGSSDWLTRAGRKGQYEWERGPYYARGLLALAWIVDDAALKEKAKRWVEAILAGQLENGDFGPKRENWWANMLGLYIVRDWYLVSRDGRCVDFVRRYIRFQQSALKKKDLHGDSVWACARGGDGMEVFLDFYDITGDEVFLEGAKLYLSQTAPWSGYYATGAGNESYQEHIVNFNQGLKTPALAWRITGRALDRDGYRAATAREGWAFRYAGRPDAMYNGEEPLSGRNTSGGTELCAQAERIISCADEIAVFADAKAADDMETVAYNCLPATLTPDLKGLRYYLALNCPRADNRRLFYAHNALANSIVPGPHAGYGCCRSNMHIAWPKFVQSMWMSTADGGLAAVAYGPCTVTAEAAGRGQVFRVTTDYPFRSRVTIELVDGGGEFPLHARIPSWAKGEKDAGTFRKIVRKWTRGDRVEFDFKSDVVVEKGWNYDSATVRKGPLLYSWNVPAEEKVVKDWGDGFATKELYPTEPWNVALVLPEKGGSAAGIEVVDDGAPIPAQPFAWNAAPVKLRVKGCHTDEVRWGNFRYEAEGNSVEPPPSPIRAPRDFRTLELVPLGCTQTRITYFPWASAGLER